MGGASPEFYTSQGNQSLIGNAPNLQQLLAQVSAAAPAPTSQTQAGSSSAGSSSGSGGAGSLINQQHQGGGLIGQQGFGGSIQGAGDPRGSVTANQTGAEAVGDLAGRNSAMTPSLANSARLAGTILSGGAMAPMSLMGDAAAAGMGLPSPFNTPGPSISPQLQQQAINAGLATYAMTRNPFTAKAAYNTALGNIRGGAAPGMGGFRADNSMSSGVGAADVAPGGYAIGGPVGNGPAAAAGGGSRGGNASSGGGGGNYGGGSLGGGPGAMGAGSNPHGPPGSQ